MPKIAKDHQTAADLTAMPLSVDLAFYEEVPDNPLFETVTTWVPRVGEIVQLDTLGDFFVVQIRWEWDEYSGHPPDEPRVYVKVRALTSGNGFEK